MKQKTAVLAIIFAIALIVILNGCDNKEPPKTELTKEDNIPAKEDDILIKAEDTKATPEGVNGIAKANNQFAFELYKEIKDSDENIFFSPYSISYALAIVCEGTRGKTFQEIINVFHFTIDPITRMSAFASIYNEVNKEEKEYRLYTANALWAQKDYKFVDSYISTIRQFYRSEATNLDFIRETDASAETINGWVKNKTKGKIKDILKSGDINDMTRMVITNAIYFKGDWVTEFDKDKTSDAPFYVTPDDKVYVKMMGLTEEKFNYAKDEELQIIELPYKGDDLSMLILLPKKSIEFVEDDLSADKLNEWKSSMSETKIDVFMPKFKFDTRYNLVDTLSRMGMPTAFSKAADMSSMDSTNNLIISKVIHQAFIEVDEEGTEAAAATAVVGTLKGIMLANEFRADHPFIFLIQQKETGNILFLGKVVDPSEYK